MSFDALAWAAKQRTGSSGTKLVLMGLAECASRQGALAFPSLAELIEFSSLNRKSIIANLDALEGAGFISDTGERAGRTRQIKVYRLHLERVPQTEPSQKRNSSEIPVKSPKNGTRNQSEPVGSEAKASSPRRAAYPPPPGVPNEIWADYRKLRDRKKAPLSDTAYRRLLAKLQQLAEAGYPPGEVVALSVERGWTGFFEPKADRNERTDPTFAALADFNRIISGNVGLGAGIGENVEACRSDLDGPGGAARMDRFGG